MIPWMNLEGSVLSKTTIQKKTNTTWYHFHVECEKTIRLIETEQKNGFKKLMGGKDWEK